MTKACEHAVKQMLVLAAMFCWASAASAQEVVQQSPVPSPGVAKPPGPPPPLPRPPVQGKPNADAPAVEKIGPGLFRLGDIQINKKEHSISLPAVVNMDKGMLEYLLVRTGGKTHESLFRTGIEPVELQVALLLLGLEGTDRPLARQGDPETPKGNPVEVSVTYHKDGKIMTVKPEVWVAKKVDDKLTEGGSLEWVFTGSLVHNKRFMAQVEGSIIALYHDPVAMIDNATPGGESDRIWYVKTGSIPPIGTPLTLTIRAKK